MRKFLNFSFALALVAGLFAGSLASVGATSPVYGPENPGASTIFFPFVHNGTTVDGMKFDGQVVVQNLEVFPIDVTVADASGKALASNVLLNPRASKTWSASGLGVAAGGGGVIAHAVWDGSAIDNMVSLGMCASQDVPLTRGTDAGGTDQATSDFPRIDAVGGITGYHSGTDYNVSVSGSKVFVDWSPKGNEPAAGVGYTITVYYCGDPNIGGVEKHESPSGSSVVTNATQTTVDGSSAVPLCDLAVASDQSVTGCFFGQGDSTPELDMNNQFRWILPIVQTNTGWDTVLHVTNVSGGSNVGVNAYFYAASGQGVGGPSSQLFSENLASGSTISYDLMADGGFPAGVVGSVWIDADAGVVASVDRVKPATDMALTNVAQPRNDNTFNYFKTFGINPTTKYAPLVFRDYNNWNTGLNVANLSSNTNEVTISYHNYSDNSSSTETISIPPRAMEYVYRPGSGSDAGLSVGNISAAVISGTDPIAVAVDEVKYTGTTQDVGQAMSYPAQEGVFAGFAYDTGQFPALTDLLGGLGRVVYNADLSLPLMQNGNHSTGMGDFSGINLFNADADNGVTAWVQFLDSSGLPVAPTTGANERELPFKLSMPALGSAIVYTGNYSELPAPFVGSAVVGAVYPTVESANEARVTGPLVAVSNNVNYAVNGDGSAVYNLHAYYHNLPTAAPGCYYPGFSNGQGNPLLCVPIPLQDIIIPTPQG